jgi:F0F1-type ATP synthase delta subunit
MEQLNLTPFFTTKSQANEFAIRLNSFSESVYNTQFSLEKASMQYFGMKKSEAFLRLLHDNDVSPDSAAAIKTFVAKMQDAIKTAPLLTVTLAFEPSEKVLRTLSDWFVMNLKKQFLLDIQIDPTIIAGALIRYKGQYLDVSSKPLIERIVQENLAPRPKQETHTEIQQTPEHFHMGR